MANKIRVDNERIAFVFRVCFFDGELVFSQNEGFHFFHFSQALELFRMGLLPPEFGVVRDKEIYGESKN
jgi:hypothetical protein